MTASQIDRFIQRCEAAAAWRASIAARSGDDRSLASAAALRAESDWARSDPQGARDLMVESSAKGLDFTHAWGEAREYVFTTYCLHGRETREHWLRRVANVQV